jgi:hypothetical protein
LEKERRHPEALDVRAFDHCARSAHFPSFQFSLPSGSGFYRSVKNFDTDVRELSFVNLKSNYLAFGVGTHLDKALLIPRRMK